MRGILRVISLLPRSNRYYSHTLFRLQMNSSQNTSQRMSFLIASLPKLRSHRPMSVDELTEIFMNLSRSNEVSDHHYLVQDLVRELSSHLTNFPKSFHSPHELGIAFRSLSTLTIQTPEIQTLHLCLTKLIPKQGESNFSISINTLLDIYSSLSNLPSHFESSHQLLVTMLSHLQSQITLMNPTHCSDLLYCFQSSSQTSSVVLETLEIVTNRINVLFPTQTSNPKSMSIKLIAKCMFGVRNFSNMNETKLLLQLLSRHFINVPPEATINLVEIHHIISCLHGPKMNIHRLEIKAFIDSFCERIEYKYADLTPPPSSLPLSLSLVSQPLKPQSLSTYSSGWYITDILSSFGNQSSDNPLTQQLLVSINSFLTVKATDGKKTKLIPRYYLTPRQIGLCMLGMKQMSCSHMGVGDVVESLSRYMKKSMNNPENYSEIYPVHSHLTGHDISNCLQGVGAMSDEDPAVKHFLLSIYEKLKYFRDVDFTVSDICVSLNGFRGMTSKYQKVTQLIEILMDKFRKLVQDLSTVELSGSKLSLALSGLQRMTPSEQLPNLKTFIDFLLLHGKSSIPSMQFTHLQITFTSLVYMILSYLPLPTQFIHSLLRQLSHTLQSSSVEGISDVPKLILFQSIHLLKSSSAELTPSIKQSMNEIPSILAPSIPLVQPIENKYENKIFRRLSIMFENNPNVSLLKYQMINGFATDILLTINLPSQSTIDNLQKNQNWDQFSWKKHQNEAVYNIEIDGPGHDVAKKQFYYSIRDEYFKSVGITVIRLPLKECGYHSGAKLDNFLRNTLKEFMSEELLYNKK